MNEPPGQPLDSELDLEIPARSPAKVNAKPKRKRPTRQLVIILAIASVLGLSIAATTAWYLWPRSVKDPFTSSQRATLGPLYYPAKLPDGYSIDYKSINQPERGILVFTITSERGPELFVSQQAMPEDVNIDSFYRKMKQATNLQTPVGSGKTGIIQESGSNQRVASITMTGIRPIWIIINTSPNTPDSTLKEIAQQYILSQ